ncbi:peptide-N4-(N-acetyl-beta-glucosaminyl)asparagine amidase A [Solanum lycopersicum]|uniref:peptide-N4-(N-acetyl-beta- glucosaminyl)asparagine amidase A n=1 Tax=Solanum lycopersicum TaxID=4081 RepID=UPI0002BC8C34|nr:peptide-N4-(N-acetyl-beta-glucosaminyl)asparagine amidase A [Solanum lycopersicum]
MSNLQLFFFLIVIIINFINAPICSSLQHPSHFIRHGYFQQKYLEINRPLPFANLTPSCTLPILSHHFGDTIGLPPVSVAYAPPENCSWNHVALQFNASSNGVQYDRIAAVWLDGADLLRTSTAEPTESGGFWTVTKDVTRYSSLLAKQDISLSVMMENIVNDVYTGAYYVNLTILYYYIEEMNVPLSATRNNRKVRMVDDVFVDNSMSLYEKPADLIIPISGYNRGEGFWFRIRSDSELKGKSVIIPKNTYRAVMEICVSFHGLDEFWYSNPPDSYIRANNLTSQRGHGSYREVLLNIDRNLVGSVVPFPVIYPGGINPLYWDPIVSIGAFDHPSYDIDITPFLGDLLDGKSHFMGFKVLDSLPFWLLDANMHLWIDKQCTSDCEVQGEVVDYGIPDYEMERSSSFKGLDGSYEVELKRKSKYDGWVNSSAGNLTTKISRELKFKNEIKFDNKGTEKKVEQKVEEEIEISVVSETGTKISHTSMKREYPLTITTKTWKPSREDGTIIMHSELEHERNEEKNWSNGHSHSYSSRLKNGQKCKGWMSVKDRIVLQGGATTEQSYSYNGEASTYSREIAAANGKLVHDTATYSKFPSVSAM